MSIESFPFIRVATPPQSQPRRCVVERLFEIDWHEFAERAVYVLHQAVPVLAMRRASRFDEVASRCDSNRTLKRKNEQS